MVEIRCKVCKRMAFKASEDATGLLETRCNRCGRTFTVILPLKNAGGAKDVDVSMPRVASNSSILGL
jgi:phage FluMu protein Com